MKKVVIALVVLIPLFYLFAPIALGPAGSLIPHKFTSITDAKDYYSSMASIMTMLLGLSGLLLGYFYYSLSHTRTRLTALMAELSSYDQKVFKILYAPVKDQQTLDETRAEIIRIFDGITIMLDAGLTFSGLKQEDLDKILQVNSLIDQSPAVMYDKLEILKATDLRDSQAEYSYRMGVARLACYLKLK